MEADSIQLSWQPNNNSVQQRYDVWYVDLSESASSHAVLVGINVTNCIVDKLEAGHNYTFTLYAISFGERSLGVDLHQNTSEYVCLYLQTAAAKGQCLFVILKK